MKLVIWAKDRNFSTRDVYVVENLTESQVNRIQKNGIPTLTKLFQAERHYIMPLDYSVVEDNEDVSKGRVVPPYVLSYENSNWVSRRNINVKKVMAPDYSGDIVYLHDRRTLGSGVNERFYILGDGSMVLIDDYKKESSPNKAA
jgi:hypothetical protein